MVEGHPVKRWLLAMLWTPRQDDTISLKLTLQQSTRNVCLCPQT
jgi:hypothetical protein